MYLADTLSRASLKDVDPEMLNVVHSVVEHLPMSENRLFKKAIQEDSVLKVVYQYCMNGWPDNIKNIPDNENMPDIVKH